MAALSWHLRPDAAPAPHGQVAQGAVIGALLARLAALDDAQRALLRAVAAPGILVLLGPGAALPWVDGARYCAPDPLQRMLWLPTDVQPQAPLDLVLANLSARGASLPFLLWDAPQLVLPLGRPLALDRAGLAWLTRELAS
ncbi:hypothetical protein INH39_21040 [Massilia violaceinigra]|uniref:MoxR-vWA-beta-propeller ternary system domain-containing protein n=1 Tax=Massilia violaceinigra TaxID=2045208 RepID=A0ABY4A317_9BURK|nr:hypothetical protein [Massilia violaceinigra]UOD27956.1 hypothetical protein INH39_21040 [Massilia violaceinigra]